MQCLSGMLLSDQLEHDTDGSCINHFETEAHRRWSPGDTPEAAGEQGSGEGRPPEPAAGCPVWPQQQKLTV